MTLFNTSACIWLATMHLSPTNEKLWVNKWLKIKLKQANMTHLLNNILTDQLLLSFNFFLLSILLNCQSLWWDYFPSMRLFPFAPYWMTDDYSTTTVNISSQENSVFLLFYWADCRSRFIKISPCKYLPCFKFLRPCNAKIYCYTRSIKEPVQAQMSLLYFEKSIRSTVFILNSCDRGFIVLLHINTQLVCRYYKSL